MGLFRVDSLPMHAGVGEARAMIFGGQHGTTGVDQGTSGVTNVQNPPPPIKSANVGFRDCLLARGGPFRRPRATSSDFDELRPRFCIVFFFFYSNFRKSLTRHCSLPVHTAKILTARALPRPKFLVPKLSRYLCIPRNAG